MNKTFGIVLFALLLAVATVSNMQSVSAYSPQKGDYFKYSETITVNNGQGSYTGYNDQSQVSGTEQMNGVNGSIVSASYDYSFQFSSNQGSSTSSSLSGTYTWSSSNFTYVNGTDNQIGYSRPIYVWFAANTSIPVGGTFYVLNTQFTVLSKNYSFQLPTENKFIQTIQAQGTGQYQRNDSYGIFTASYTWTDYFDPSTGYFVGYNYVEQDVGQYQGKAGNFTYTDNNYVTSTSYVLAPATPAANFSSSSTTTTNTAGFFEIAPFLIYLVVFVVIILIIVVAVLALSRRRKSLPKHPYSPTTPPPAPPTTPWESKVDLGSKPPEQVVVREVAMVNCKYCGTLIPTTAQVCPHCGAPLQ